MKTMLSLFLAAVLALPAIAAAESGGNAFALYSAASGATKTSSAFPVRNFRTKTVTISGATLTSNATAVTFKNMSGTVTAECAPSDGGPWSTCVANDYAQTAVSKTTNGTFTWSDASAYVRLKWVAGTVGTKLKAYFNWITN